MDTTGMVPELARVVTQLEADRQRGEQAAVLLRILLEATGRSEGLDPRQVAWDRTPDVEMAQAAGLVLGRRARPDKWREYVALRRAGRARWWCVNRLGLYPGTAAKLERLV